MKTARPFEELEGEHPQREVGRHILVSDSTESTNEDAKRILASLGPQSSHGYVIVTHEQTDGRGTRGRSWWSPKGTSLALSLILAPQEELERPAVLTIVAALAVTHAAHKHGSELLVKWPNDVVSLQGAKVAGILAENIRSKLTAHVIGIGVNVCQPQESLPSHLNAPISCVDETGGSGTTPNSFLRSLLDSLEHQLTILRNKGLGEISEDFNNQSFLTGHMVRLRRGGEERNCKFLGITPTLEVIFEEGSGSKKLWPGEQVEILS